MICALARTLVVVFGVRAVPLFRWLVSLAMLLDTCTALLKTALGWSREAEGHSP